MTEQERLQQALIRLQQIEKELGVTVKSTVIISEINPPRPGAPELAFIVGWAESKSSEKEV